jgi:acetolactate synthase-1/2/3 large subunit
MSIGASLGAKRRQVCVIDGDGGFQFNVQELETVRRLGLPLKLFVLNNEGYSSIRNSQTNYFGRLVGADSSSGLTLPELERIADAWRIPFRRISSSEDLRGQVRGALSSPGPLVCEVEVLPYEDRMPRIYSRVREDGSMESSPLEDLYPPLARDELRANLEPGEARTDP